MRGFLLFFDFLFRRRRRVFIPPFLTLFPGLLRCFLLFFDVVLELERENNRNGLLCLGCFLLYWKPPVVGLISINGLSVSAFNSVFCFLGLLFLLVFDKDSGVTMIEKPNKIRRI